MLQWSLAELPDPALEPAVWEDFWRASPGGWNALLRKLKHEVLAQPLKAREVLEAIPELAPPVEEASEDDEGFLEDDEEEDEDGEFAGDDDDDDDDDF